MSGELRIEIADDVLVAEAIEAREEAESTEAQASPSRWREADRYAELSRRGWSQRQIAEKCKTNQTTVSRFVRITESVPTQKRGSFWDAYAEVTGEKSTGEKLVASTENEWYTPAVYLDAARRVLGAIDLDPASSPQANEVVQASEFWTAEDDGLEQAWAGRLWLNPPYGRLAGAFIGRLVAEFAGGEVTHAIALVNAHCTDTEWFQSLWDFPLCFTDHRIDFDSAGREKKTTSTHGSVFAYLGSDVEKFVEVFSEFGPIVRRWQ